MQGDAASKGPAVPGTTGAVMLKRIPVSAALTGLALTGVLCACGSAAQHSASAGAGAGMPSSTTTPAGPPSPGRGSSPAPVSAAPVILAGRLRRAGEAK